MNYLIYQTCLCTLQWLGKIQKHAHDKYSRKLMLRISLKIKVWLMVALRGIESFVKGVGARLPDISVSFGWALSRLGCGTQRHTFRCAGEGTYDQRRH